MTHTPESTPPARQSDEALVELIAHELAEWLEWQDAMEAATAMLRIAKLERAEGKREGIEEDAVDAARWRALMSCQRVRRTGWTNDGNHIGMEFWVFHPAAHPSEEYPQDDCREGFEAFADAIRALAEKQP